MNNASTSLTIIYTLVSIALVAGGFFAATVTYFIRRRVTTGKISTSDADVLWQQSEAMRNTLQKEKELAENQRDKMIQVNGQILPMLENINSSLVKIGEALDKGEA
jgi:hypothetical protein